MTTAERSDSPRAPRLEVQELRSPDDAGAKVVRYTKPPRSRSRHVKHLARTDTMMANVQFISEGGESSLHAHPNMDGFWFVLRGRVRFYTTDDVVVADLGPHEAVLIPRDYPYWFESSGDEDLELLQVEALTKRGDPIKILRYSEEGSENPVEVSSA